MASSNFYDELVNRSFYEKTASTQEQIKTALDAFSTEEMEAIAEELGLASRQEKIAEEGVHLESALTQVEKKEQEDKRDEALESKVEGGQGKTEESQTHEGGEQSKTEEEKKETVNTQAASHAGTSEGANTQTSGDASASNNTGSDVKDLEECKDDANGTTAERTESDEKVAAVLAAYDLAAEKLASAGYSLADYVFAKVGNEKVAYEIAENAEKLAFVSEQNPLKVADDIIETIFNKLEE